MLVARRLSWCALLLAFALVWTRPCTAAQARGTAADSSAVATAPGAAYGDTLVRVLAETGRAPLLGLLRADRLQHASLSFTLAASAGLAGRSRAEAFGFTFALGFGKEVRDARRDRFDPIDLAADVIGAALGTWAAARR